MGKGERAEQASMKVEALALLRGDTCMQGVISVHNSCPGKLVAIEAETQRLGGASRKHLQQPPQVGWGRRWVHPAGRGLRGARCYLHKKHRACLRAGEESGSQGRGQAEDWGPVLGRRGQEGEGRCGKLVAPESWKCAVHAWPNGQDGGGATWVGAGCTEGEQV